MSDHSQEHEHHHHHAIEHDDSTWAHKPGTIAPHDTGVRYDTVHMGVQPATVNPLPNEPWVSSTATNSHNDKEHEHSKHPHHHLIEKDDSVWAQKQGDYSTSPANDQHTNFVPAFDATTGNRYAGQDQAESQAHADHTHGHPHHNLVEGDTSAWAQKNGTLAPLPGMQERTDMSGAAVSAKPLPNDASNDTAAHTTTEPSDHAHAGIGQRVKDTINKVLHKSDTPHNGEA